MNECKDCIHVRSSGDFELKDPGGLTYIAKYCDKLSAYALVNQKVCDQFERYIEFCPFCGSKKVWLSSGKNRILCGNCRAEGPTSDNPTEAWNRRTK